MFEILDKDGLGRICKIETNHGKIETPAILPVVNPNIPFIEVKEMEKFGAEALMTNAYILYRTAKVEKSVHEYLGTDLPVMTDSGAYQMMVYGDLEVTNREILEFQISIDSDIVIPLDIPTPPDADRDTAERDLEITLERVQEAKELVEDRTLVLPIQGSTYLDLRKKAAMEVKKIGGDIYAIGAVVPLLDTYRFSDIAKIVLEVRSVVRVEPIHLFGCGHPMVFAMAVALGCDLFDSAAYALYAKDDRYMTVHGTKKLSDLHYFPCECPVCVKFSPQELLEIEKNERAKILAEHNLYISFSEIRKIKQAIKENSLFEFVEQRIRAHPQLLSGWRKIKDRWKMVEESDPRVKRKFLYCGIESIYRPAVKRHVESMKNIELPEVVRVSTDFGILAEIYLRPVFGPVAVELLESYPAGHAEMPEEIEDEAYLSAVENLKEFIKNNINKKFIIYIDKKWERHLKDLPENCELYVLPREA